MKNLCNGKKRLLCLLLSLVLVIGLLPMSASAFEANINGSVSNIQRYDSGCLKSIDVSVQTSTYYSPAHGKIAVHSAESQYDYYHKYSTSGDQWIDLSSDPSFLALGSGEEFLWTDMQKHTMTVTFPDNVIKPGANGAETTYYVYLWTRINSLGYKGIYPDKKVGTITFGEELKFNNQVVSEESDIPHVHSWIVNTSGQGTKEAKTDIVCECGQSLSASLTAADVTLPGNVFTAKITSTSGAELRAAMPTDLTVSETPGYKYSSTGTDYKPVDPNGFEAKAGYYQASILIMDGNQQVENLYVNYIVSDPQITAATGDNRPIEMMVMGMVVFSALAAAAFVFDRKGMLRR